MGQQHDDRIPIDKGWAWVVVFASCAVFALCTGEFKCQGIILVELIERYKGIYTPSSLIWIFSVHNILLGLFGPLGSVLVVRFGHRRVTMLAVLLMTAGYVGIGYSNSLPLMILTYSVPGGLASTLAELGTILINDEYFKRRKALAFGLVMSGSGFGSIVVPFVMRPLFDHYDFTGATLLYGGFCLQFLVIAALMRPISYYKELYSLKEEGGDYSAATAQDSALPATSCEDISDVSLVKVSETRCRSTSFSHQIKEQPTLDSKIFHSVPNISTVFDKELTPLTAGHTSSTQQISAADKTDESATGCCQKSFDWKVLLIPRFLIQCLSILLFDLGVLATYAVLPALADETGVSKEAVAVALIIGGCVEIPSRIGNGYLADSKLMSAIEQYTLCTLLTAVFTLLCALVPGLPGTALGIAGLSMFGTSFFNLVPVLLREIMGGGHLTAGMGINLLLQSAAFTSGSYIIGVLYSSTNTWATVFYFFSAAMMLSSCITWPYSLQALYTRCHGNNRNVQQTS